MSSLFLGLIQTNVHTRVDASEVKGLLFNSSTMSFVFLGLGF